MTGSSVEFRGRRSHAWMDNWARSLVTLKGAFPVTWARTGARREDGVSKTINNGVKSILENVLRVCQSKTDRCRRP